MPKKITKEKISITLDINLANTLRKECEDRTMKLSSYIEKLIKAGYKDEKKK